MNFESQQHKYQM